MTLNTQHSQQIDSGILKRQWGWFIFLTVSLSLLWLIILPRAAEIPRLKSEIDFLDQKKIDPSAMFYSDLETIEDTVKSLSKFHQENPEALW